MHTHERFIDLGGAVLQLPFFRMLQARTRNSALLLSGRIARIAQMRPIATNVARIVVCVSVTLMYCEKRLNRSRCHLRADS